MIFPRSRALTEKKKKQPKNFSFRRNKKHRPLKLRPNLDTETATDCPKTFPSSSFSNLAEENVNRSLKSDERLSGSLVSEGFKQIRGGHNVRSPRGRKSHGIKAEVSITLRFYYAWPLKFLRNQAHERKVLRILLSDIKITTHLWQQWPGFPEARAGERVAR